MPDNFDHFAEAEALLNKARHHEDGSAEQHGLVNRASVHAYLASTLVTAEQVAVMRKQAEQQLGYMQRTVHYLEVASQEQTALSAPASPPTESEGGAA